MRQPSPGDQADTLSEKLGGSSFLSEALGNEFVPPRDAISPEEIYSLFRLMNIVRLSLLEPPRIRLFRQSTEIPTAEWLRRAVTRRNTISQVPNRKDLSEIMFAGATLVVDRIDELDPNLGDLVLGLTMLLRERVRVNAHYTTGATAGFPPHWDDHDVIVFQILGEKEWSLFGEARAKPMWRDADQSHRCPDENRWRGTITAGQIMYIPRGQWHVASVHPGWMQRRGC